MDQYGDFAKCFDVKFINIPCFKFSHLFDPFGNLVCPQTKRHACLFALLTGHFRVSCQFFIYTIYLLHLISFVFKWKICRKKPRHSCRPIGALFRFFVVRIPTLLVTTYELFFEKVAFCSKHSWKLAGKKKQQSSSQFPCSTLGRNASMTWQTFFGNS